LFGIKLEKKTLFATISCPPAKKRIKQQETEKISKIRFEEVDEHDPRKTRRDGG
jgi:hypothetical protein